MRTVKILLIAALVWLIPSCAQPQQSNHFADSGKMVATTQATRPATQPIKRDAKGRIVRSQAARREFMRQTGYPNGRPGYIIDHIIPLKRGGLDEPSNMQWQTIAEAKEKDKTE